MVVSLAKDHQVSIPGLVGPSVVTEEVLVDVHDLDTSGNLHNDGVLDHELGELEAIDIHCRVVHFALHRTAPSDSATGTGRMKVCQVLTVETVASFVIVLLEKRGVGGRRRVRRVW